MNPNPNPDTYHRLSFLSHIYVNSIWTVRGTAKYWVTSFASCQNIGGWGYGYSVGLSDKTFISMYFAFCDSWSHCMTLTPTFYIAPSHQHIFGVPLKFSLGFNSIFCHFLWVYPHMYHREQFSTTTMYQA